LNELCEAICVPYVTTIQNNDPKGVEYAAILKNIIGIATGMAGGLNYGENFQAVITSNAMREIEQFLAVACPAKRDLFNSAYFGDMLVTAYSDYSRNRTLGKLIGRGFPLHKALQAMEMVAEGYNASKELYQVLKKLALNLPLINCVYRVLHLHANPFHEFKLIEKQLV
jgi:glycerol-3-phosphate dehydrogenase (NAD(P)+)